MTEESCRAPAPFEAFDFALHPDRERRLINRWVEEQTRDRIRELIPPDGIDEETRLVLVNAIHMQAPWQEPFPESATGPAPFHLAPGKPVDVPTLRRQGRLGYAQRDGYRAVTVPYLGGPGGSTVFVCYSASGQWRVPVSRPGSRSSLMGIGRGVGGTYTP